MKSCNQKTFFYLLLLVPAVSCWPQRAPIKTLTSKIDSIVTRGISTGFPSISLSVIIDGKVAYSKAYGYADKKRKIPATTKTCYQIGSLTKTFTGNLLAKFIIENKLFLFDTIQRYFPKEVRFPKDSANKSITVFNLATHTASVPRYPSNLVRKDGDPILGFSKAQLYEGINAMTLSRKMGTTWDYSNFGYAILGAAMENIAGTPLQDLLREHIFKPLHMTSSSLVLTDPIKKILATPYRDDNPDIATVPWDMGTLSAAGNIFSNVEDLSKFMLYQINEADEATKLQHLWLFSLGESLGYGIGCFTGFSKSKNTRIIYHGGDVDGYASDCNFLPDLKMGLVILTNCGKGREFSQISTDVFNAIYQYIAAPTKIREQGK